MHYLNPSYYGTRETARRQRREAIQSAASLLSVVAFVIAFLVMF